MERCEVVLSFSVNVMRFISFRRVYMSILVKPCQLSGRCPLSPLKKKAEFRGIRLLLEIQVVAEKAKTSPKSTSNNHSSQGLLSILLVFFLSFPSSTFPKPTFKNHQPPPPPNSASRTVKPPGFFSLPCFNHQFCCDSSKSTTICSPPHGGLGEDLNTWRRVMAPILRSGPLLRRGTSAEILRDLKRDARHIGGAICRVFYF